MSKLLANFLLLPLLLHPVFQGPFKPKSARSAPIRASFLTSNPAPGPLHLAPGRQVGSSAPPRGTRGRALSPLPRAAQGSVPLCPAGPDPSVRLPSTRARPPPPSCPLVSAQSSLPLARTRSLTASSPPSHRPIPPPRSAPSGTAASVREGLQGPRLLCAARGAGEGDRPPWRRACRTTSPCCLGLGSPARPDDLGPRLPRYLRWKRQRQ